MFFIHKIIYTMNKADGETNLRYWGGGGKGGMGSGIGKSEEIVRGADRTLKNDGNNQMQNLSVTILTVSKDNVYIEKLKKKIFFFLFFNSEEVFI